MKLFLFDERSTDAWHPFSLTRPAAELLFGAHLLRERLERFAGRPCTATLTRGWLSSFAEPGGPVAHSRDSGLPPGEKLLLSSRFVPGDGERFEGRGNRPVLLVSGSSVAGCYLPEGSAAPGSEWLEVPDGVPLDGDWVERPVVGDLLGGVWNLIALNAERLAADLTAAARGSGMADGRVSAASRVGEGPVHLGQDVRIEPGVVFDTRRGPVRLADGVDVRAGARLEGPLYAGPGTQLLGGSYSSLSAGPQCRLRGEIEDSVILGYTNKAHDGFLGHAYLGRWVNLGALTTNSDLKNNYGPVRLGGPDGEVETGLLKLGCLLGDHVKTAIGTRINTGSVIGAGSNLFGDAMPAKWVPPFSWGSARAAPVYAKDRFLEVAETVMRRRDEPFDAATRKWLAACWSEARGDG